MKKILIICPNWIGDIIMSQSLLKELKNQEPDTLIDVLGPSWSLEITSRMTEVNKQIIFENRHKKLDFWKRIFFAKKLKKENYHLAIILPLSLKSALIPFIAGIPLRRAYLGESRFFLINQCIKKKELRRVDEYLNLASFPYKKHSLNFPSLSVNKSSAQKLKKKYLSQSKEALILCPGAAKGPSKQWPAHYFAEIATYYANKNYEIIILGSKADLEISNAIQKFSNNICVNLCGKTSLNETCDILSLAKIVISNDSGLMHLSAALQIPQVAIYGSTSPKKNPPLNTKSETIYLNMQCSPCEKRTCPYHHYDCLTKISPEMVKSKIKTLLK